MFNMGDVRRILLVGLLYMLLVIGMYAQENNTNSSLVQIEVQPYYQYRKDGQAGRALSITMRTMSAKFPLTVKVACEGFNETTVIEQSDVNGEFIVLLPANIGVNKSVNAELTFPVEGKELKMKVAIPKKKKWTVFIYPHSHLDIGYTGLPETVQQLQNRNIDVGIDIARKTQNYPEGSRFVWNPESTWIVKNYLAQASVQQKALFIEAVRKGWLQIDGGHSNCNTTTFSDEEMLHFFDNVDDINKVTQQRISSMVQMDVPGAAWGLVKVASQSGITGLINFPNNYDVRKQWEHKPFYWLSPDGKTKMLFLQGLPYGIGYTLKGSKYGLAKLQTFSKEYDRVTTSDPMKNFIDPFIFRETDKLEQTPYDLFAMTWSMADNCVIDADLPEAVKQWNKKYAYPKLIISGSKDILAAYEKKYAAIIPTYKGDFTEFWTNGLGSDAISVGEGRKGKELLVQAEILSTLLNSPDQTSKIKNAWELSLLSAEHTWGAQNSRSILAEQVEALKASYFIDAEKQSRQLMNDIVAPFMDSSSSSFSIINTLSWKRDGIVTLSKEQSRFGDGVKDDNDHFVPSQRLSTGELIFMATDIPAFGSKIYTTTKASSQRNGKLRVDSYSLENEMLLVTLDQRSGNIKSIRNKKSGYEYVDTSVGINSYQYIKGVYNGKDFPRKPTTSSNVTISVKEKGPLLVSLVVTSVAEGITNFKKEIKVYSNRAGIEIINSFDKIETYQKEAVHFGFGFNIPESVIHIDMPWSIVSPNEDQIDGSNKNWLSFQRWVDISSDGHGITWTATQAPLIEIGSLSGNVLDGARQSWLWQKTISSSSTLYSWPLNNHWDTNFPSKQGGEMRQEYSISFHDGYDVVRSNRYGMEMTRSLVVVQSKANLIPHPLIEFKNPNLFVSTFTKSGESNMYVLRLRSVSPVSQPVDLKWASTGTYVGDNLKVEPYGSLSIKFMGVPGESNMFGKKPKIQ